MSYGTFSIRQELPTSEDERGHCSSCYSKQKKGTLYATQLQEQSTTWKKRVSQSRKASRGKGSGPPPPATSCSAPSPAGLAALAAQGEERAAELLTCLQSGGCLRSLLGCSAELLEAGRAGEAALAQLQAPEGREAGAASRRALPPRCKAPAKHCSTPDPPFWESSWWLRARQGPLPSHLAPGSPALRCQGGAAAGLLQGQRDELLAQRAARAEESL